jgi:hypothetical protein
MVPCRKGANDSRRVQVSSPSFDLVAKKSFVAIGDGRKAWRGCAALFGSRLDRYIREACVLELAADPCGIVVAMRRAGKKERRVVWKHLRESLGDVVREHILLDAIAHAEQKAAMRLQNTLCFR